MNYFSDAVVAAVHLIFKFDVTIYEIVWTSLKISMIATLFSSLLGVIVGIWMAISEFTGKRFLEHLLNTLMAMPTVMIGLIFYGLLSRKGPLGELGLLYTQTAVILGEACLILPIIMNMTLVAVQSADNRMIMTLKILGAKTWQQILLILSELRFVILAAVITGFGRAIGEVGAAMMLGGNIQGSTRTMTTAIALETSKGDFELGLALGFLLLLIAFAVNLLLRLLESRA
jgi:tungstate transport system permease protein